MTDKDHGHIESRIAEVVAAQGVRFLGLKHSLQRGLRLFEVTADTDEGITLEQLSAVSKVLTPLLDDEFDGAGYRLDATSPGLDRPLTEAWQYNRHRDRRARIDFETQEGRRSVECLIIGEQGGVVSVSADGETMEIPLENIRTGVIIPVLDARESGKDSRRKKTK
jgi:ribosome maturation factor RimP